MALAPNLTSRFASPNSRFANQVLGQAPLWSVTLTESVSSAELFMRAVAKTRSDVFAPTDAAIRATGKAPFADTVSTTEIFARAASKTINESIAVLDSAASRGIGKAAGDNLASSESLLRTTNRSASDGYSLLDSFTARSILGRAFSDGASLSDSLQRIGFKSWTDVVGMAEAFQRAGNKALGDLATSVESVIRTLARELDDGGLLAEQAMRGAAKALADGLACIETFTTAGLLSRTLSDAAMPLDSLVRDTGKPMADALPAIELFITASLLSRALSDSFAPQDGLANSTQRTVFDAYALTDNWDRMAVLARELDDLLSQSDNLILALMRPLPTDALTLGDLRAITAGLTFSDVVTGSDGLIKLAGKLIQDAALISDQPVSIGSLHGGGFSDVLSLIEQYAATAILHRIVNDVFFPADAFSRVAACTFSDSSLAIESLRRSSGRTLTDSCSLFESFSRAGSQWTRTLQDANIPAESIARLIAKTWSETNVSVDVILGIAAMHATADGLSISESLPTCALSRVFLTIVAMADTMQRAAPLDLADALAVTETYAAIVRYPIAPPMWRSWSQARQDRMKAELPQNRGIPVPIDRRQILFQSDLRTVSPFDNRVMVEPSGL